jgi:hypothetical protein
MDVQVQALWELVHHEPIPGGCESVTIRRNPLDTRPDETMMARMETTTNTATRRTLSAGSIRPGMRLVSLCHAGPPVVAVHKLAEVGLRFSLADGTATMVYEPWDLLSVEVPA